jgi:phage/plasmid-like protein (TIGR03299 family)
MSTSADKSRSTDNRLTGTRVVCANTLTVALGEANKSAVRTRHSTAFDARLVKEKMGIVTSQNDAAWEKFRSDMERLADKKVSSTEATEILSELLRPAGERAKPRQQANATSFAELLNAPVGTATNFANTDKESPERAIRGLAELEQSYYRAPGAVPGTAYGMLQGITHYIDHARGRDADKRQTSAWFGQGENLKNKAFADLLAM